MKNESIRFRVSVTGGVTVPEPETIKSDKNVAEELEKLLPELSFRNGILLHAPVGAGKTYAIIHRLLPWALERGLRMLYVSSRNAINTQVKRDIIAVTGEDHFVEELTDCGWQAQRDFDGITVLTYHALYFMMRRDPNSLRKYDILAFDEIHALLEDASFVPYSGYVLNHLMEFFGTAIRIYMSATPEEILPYLAKVETPYRLRVIRFRRDYAFVRPYFFHDETEVIRLINEDKSDQKWLLYCPSIQQANNLQRNIHHSCVLLNSITREQNPSEWNRMLCDKKFDSKIALASAAIDAGVSFIDPSLKNVVVFSYDLTTVVQVLGRKRRKGLEMVRLFVWCPNINDVHRRYHQNEEVQQAFQLHDANYALWVDQHILRPSTLDMRDLVIPDANGRLKLNPLAIGKISGEQHFLEELMRRAKTKHGDCEFDRLLIRRLGLKGVNLAQSWLDSTKNGKAKADLESLVTNVAGQNMDESEFREFADKFRDLCVATYGKGRGGKDRDDRTWGCRKIANKLREFGGQYCLHFNPNERAYYIEMPGEVGEGQGTGGEPA